jgi:type VI protein secretion system component VasF
MTDAPQAPPGPPHDSGQPCARTHPRGLDVDRLASDYRVAAALPARGGRPWPGRDDLAVAVDELRRLLTTLGRSRSATARQAGAEIAAAAVVELRRLARRAAAAGTRRRQASAEQLRAAVAERRATLAGPSAGSPARTHRE